LILQGDFKPEKDERKRGGKTPSRERKIEIRIDGPILLNELEP
jgi:hypothetical protein